MGSITNGKLFLPTIGGFLREKREKAGLNQEVVAMETGIARSNIPKYEKGEVDMPTSKLPELCQLYKCRMGDCGRRVDDEMGFYTAAQDAAKSKFTEMQYMSFAAGTPMVPIDYESMEELEFSQLIQAMLRFRETELLRLELPEQEAVDRVRRNYAFFMVEFIKKNVVDKDRRTRLLKLCSEALAEDMKLGK